MNAPAPHRVCSLLVLCLASYFLGNTASAQPHVVDSLKHELASAVDDTTVVHILCGLTKEMLGRDLDSALFYVNQAQTLAERRNFLRGIAKAVRLRGELTWLHAKYDSAMQLMEKSLCIFESLDDQQEVARCMLKKVPMLSENGENKEALRQVQEALRIARMLKDKRGIALAMRFQGVLYSILGPYDEALDILERSRRLFDEEHSEGGVAGCLSTMADITLSRGPIDHAKELSERSLQIYQRNGHHFGVAHCLMTMGIIYERQNLLQEAIEYYQNSYRIFDAGSNWKSAAAARLHISNCIYSLDRKKGLAQLEECLAFAEKHGLRNVTTRCLVELGKAKSDAGYRSEAFQHYRRALGMYRESGDQVHTCDVLCSLGTLSYDFGRYDDALQYFNQGLKIAETIGRTSTTVALYNGLGCVAQAKGSYRDALTYFQNAVPLLELLGEKRGLSVAQMNIGIIHGILGSKTEELHHYQKALETVEETQYYYAVIRSCILIGGYYQRQGTCCYAEAERYLLRAEQQALQVGDQKALLHCSLSLGALKREQKDYAASESYFLKVLEISERSGYQQYVRDALDGIASLLGECNRYADALQYQHRILSLNESKGDLGAVAASLCKIGWFYHLTGDQASAIEHLQRSLKIATELEKFSGIQCALQRLQTLYTSINDYKNAYEYYQRLVTHRDSIRTSEDKQKCNELMVKYETAQREREIELLEKDKSLQVLELARRDEMLRRHAVERLQRLQEIELLHRSTEIQQLEMNMTAANLRSTEAEAARKQQRIALLEKDRKLKAATLDRETMLRNGAIGGALLILLLSMLLYRHLRQRRRVSELRAEVAESKVHAAVVETLRVQAEAERKEKDIQRQFSHRLLDSQEQERKRIAAELHDSLGQELVVIKNSLLMVKDNTGTEEDLDHAIDGVGETLENVRRISRDLRPLQLDYYGIEKALRALAARINESSRLQVQVEIGSFNGALDKDAEVNIFRIVQEGLNNILRHADAETARVMLLPENGSLLLVIDDDGKGLPEDATERERLLLTGFGLKGIAERVRILEGEMKMDSKCGNGTRIEIRIPVAHIVQRTVDSEVHETA